MRNIRLKVWYAFGDNVLGIPLAAGVLYPFRHPALAGRRSGIGAATTTETRRVLRLVQELLSSSS